MIEKSLLFGNGLKQPSLQTALLIDDPIHKQPSRRNQRNSIPSNKLNQSGSLSLSNFLKFHVSETSLSLPASPIHTPLPQSFLLLIQHALSSPYTVPLRNYSASYDHPYFSARREALRCRQRLCKARVPDSLCQQPFLFWINGESLGLCPEGCDDYVQHR